MHMVAQPEQSELYSCVSVQRPDPLKYTAHEGAALTGPDNQTKNCSLS